MKTICKHCGAQLEAGAAFCPYCDMKLAAPLKATAGFYIGTDPPSKKKLSKAALIGIIAAVAAVVAFIMIINPVNNAMFRDYFIIGKDQVPSMKLVLGELRKVSNVTSSSTFGVLEIIIEYRVFEKKDRDMAIYEEALKNDFGFIETNEYNPYTGAGSAGFVKESVKEGYLVFVRLDDSNTGYTLTIKRGIGTFTLDDDDDPAIESGSGNDGIQYLTGALTDFTRGSYSVNQMIEKYGSPESVEALIINGKDRAQVSIKYPNAIITFLPTDAKQFSLYDDSSMKSQFPLGEKDKDIKLELRQVYVYGLGVELPYGLEIGTSTKQEVMEAYGEEPEYQEKNELTNHVVFMDPIGERCSITYNFNKEDVLESASLIWRQ